MPKESKTSTPVSTNRGGIPEGVHRFRIIDFEEREGGSGFPYWMFVCEIVEGPAAGERIWTNVSHSPRAKFKMDEFLDAMDEPEGKKVFGEDFLGRTFRGKVVKESRTADDGATRMQAAIAEFLGDSGKKAAAAKATPKPARPGGPRQPRKPVQVEESGDNTTANTEPNGDSAIEAGDEPPF